MPPDDAKTLALTPRDGLIAEIGDEAVPAPLLPFEAYHPHAAAFELERRFASFVSLAEAGSAGEQSAPQSPDLGRRTASGGVSQFAAAAVAYGVPKRFVTIPKRQENRENAISE